MPKYELRLTTAAAKDLDELSLQQRERIEDEIEDLATEPRPRGAIKLVSRGECASEWATIVSSTGLTTTLDSSRSG